MLAMALGLCGYLANLLAEGTLIFWYLHHNIHMIDLLCIMLDALESFFMVIFT